MDTSTTIRQRMQELLSEAEYDARALSKALGIPEKEVFHHLSHLARSAAARNKRFFTRSARCINCGYRFADRKRLTKPGRCPRCKSEYIESPAFRIM